MSSRYDGPTEPDYDRYEARPVEDVDVPDLEAPDEVCLPGGGSGAAYATGGSGGPYHASSLAQTIDPAEYAMQAIIEALGTMDKEVATAHSRERADQLWKMLKRAWADVTRVTDNAGDQVDRFVEKLR